MRVAAFFVYLILNFLIGGNYFHTPSTASSSRKVHTQHGLNHHRAKFTLNEFGSSIIESADLDIEEECLNDDDIQHENGNDFHVQKNIAPGSSFLARSHIYALNYHESNLKTFPPFCGKSNPIYITNRALRL